MTAELEPTTERLARALEQAGMPAAMIDRARAGEYDDFKSDRAFPLIELVAELRRVGTNPAVHIASRVIAGEFEATDAEAAAWAMSPEGQAAMRGVGGLG